MSSSLKLNPGMFIQPKAAPVSAWTGHIPFAGWLVTALRPRILVELGTHYGASYLAFCQAVREAGLGVRTFAVDTWKGDEHSGLYGEDVYSELHGYNQAHYGDFSTLMRSTFDDAVGYFEAGSIDLLHIDGLHTYEAVHHDFETWKPKLSSRAVVLFHDTCVRERGFGVWKFFSEVRGKYPSFEFTHTHGLGVIAFGSEVPDEIKALTTLTEEQRVLVQDMFSRLGDSAGRLAENDRLRSVLAQLRDSGEAHDAGQLRDLRDLLLSQEHAIRLDMINVKESVLAAVEASRRESAKAIGDVQESILAESRTFRKEHSEMVVDLKESLLAEVRGLQNSVDEAIRGAVEAVRSSEAAMRKESTDAFCELQQVVRSGTEHQDRRVQDLAEAVGKASDLLVKNMAALAKVERMIQEHFAWQHNRSLGARLRRMLGRRATVEQRLK